MSACGLYNFAPKLRDKINKDSIGVRYFRNMNMAVTKRRNISATCVTVEETRPVVNTWYIEI